MKTKTYFAFRVDVWDGALGGATRSLQKTPPRGGSSLGGECSGSEGQWSRVPGAMLPPTGMAVGSIRDFGTAKVVPLTIQRPFDIANFVGHLALDGLHHSAILSDLSYRLFPNANDKCLLNGFLKVGNIFLVA